MRDAALRRVVNYFDRQGCPSIIGGEQHGVGEGVPVTTDFVVSEVPPLKR